MQLYNQIIPEFNLVEAGEAGEAAQRDSQSHVLTRNMMMG